MGPKGRWVIRVVFADEEADDHDVAIVGARIMTLSSVRALMDTI